MGPGMGPGADMPTFAGFDADGDGAISEQEYVDGRNRRIAERAAAGYPMRGLGQTVDFSAADSDGNGSLSPEEFAAMQAGHGPGR
jgi:Ca2+-binding EF-hand superfamily protein